MCEPKNQITPTEVVIFDSAMATVDSLPVLESKGAPPYDDEKQVDKEKDFKSVSGDSDVADLQIGEVFDDARIVDLDENGKERPIGIVERSWMI